LVFDPNELVAVSDTVIFPVAENVTECGPAPVAVAGLAPEPKSHAHDVGVPVEASVKITVPPVQALVMLAEKFATGMVAVGGASP